MRGETRFVIGAVVIQTADAIKETKYSIVSFVFSLTFSKHRFPFLEGSKILISVF